MYIGGSVPYMSAACRAFSFGIPCSAHTMKIYLSMYCVFTMLPLAGMSQPQVSAEPCIQQGSVRQPCKSTIRE